MFRHYSSRAAAIAAVLALTLCFTHAQAATKPARTSISGAAPKSILFVGNSFFYYNNSMHTQVLGLARAADAANKDAYRYTSVTISGSGFDWHDVESYFRPNAVGKYSFVGDNEVVLNKFDKPFDAAILNDCSQCPIHPQLKATFHEYAKRHSDTVRKHGAQPVFFMT